MESYGKSPIQFNIFVFTIKMITSDNKYIEHVECTIRVRVMVFNATFNNISVLLEEEKGVSRANYKPAIRH
jgi:hypothetical protein